MEHLQKIEDNLYLGSMAATQPEILKKYGITYVIHIGFELNFINENEDTSLNNIKEEYIELEDNAQSVDNMMNVSEYVVRKIKELIKTETILVCCVAGRSRSASMITLYLHDKYPDLTYEEIIGKIKKVRSISINKTFEDAIRSRFLRK